MEFFVDSFLSKPKPYSNDYSASAYDTSPHMVLSLIKRQWIDSNLDENLTSVWIMMSWKSHKVSLNRTSTIKVIVLHFKWALIIWKEEWMTTCRVISMEFRDCLSKYFHHPELFLNIFNLINSTLNSLSLCFYLKVSNN